MRVTKTDVNTVLVARTDDRGHFEISAVPAGEYDLAVTVPTFEEMVETRITIEQGIRYQWVMRLRRASSIRRLSPQSSRLLDLDRIGLAETAHRDDAFSSGRSR